MSKLPPHQFVHFAPPPPFFFILPPPPSTLTICQFSNFSRKKGLSSPVTSNSFPHTFCGWNYNLRVREGYGKRKGGRAKWTIIPLLTSKYIPNVVVFAEFLWRDLNFTSKIVGIYKAFWQSKTVTKSLECKNQISAPKRLKNGPSKIVVSKTSISALNTVDTVLISPLLAEFGLRSRYCCGNTQIFVFLILQNY